MSKVALKTDLLKEALKSYDKNLPIELKDGKNTVIPFVDSNKDLLEFLNEHIPLTDSQKSKISGYLFASDKLGDLESGSVTDLYNKLSFISEATEPVLEIKINNKWYPLLASISKFKTFSGAWVIEMSAYGYLGGALQYLESLGYSVFILWEKDILKGKENFIHNFFEDLVK